MSARTQFTFDSTPNIVFNDNTTDPLNWYNLTNRLFDTEVRNVEDTKRDQGIEDYDSVLSKGLAKLKVAIFAESMGKLNELVMNLKKAFNPLLTQENVASDEGYLPIQWTEVINTTSYAVEVWVKAIEIPRVQLNENGTGATTEISLKAKDPVKVSQTTKGITVLNGASATGTNSGDMPASVVITLTGPTAANPKVTYTQTGEYMQISDTLGPADVYVIDHKNATIKKNGVNAYDKKATGSVFFDLNSGAITLAGLNLSTGNAAVAYKDTWTL